MLQQTQVSRVIPAWEAFLTEMPSPAACAAAGQAHIVRRWEGMGYHRRAVALHRCATEIVELHGGDVPNSREELESLSGIGPYTARAVMAFAFEFDVAVVDTNVARIISRAVIGEPLSVQRTQHVADALVPKGQGWRHNQAMLDHGALICRARPDCAKCVLVRSCAWARSGFLEPDPARCTAGTARPQAKFEGSDRQLRGLLLDAARKESSAFSWRSDLENRFGAERVALTIDALVSEAIVVRSASGLRLA